MASKRPLLQLTPRKSPKPIKIFRKTDTPKKVRSSRGSTVAQMRLSAGNLIQNAEYKKAFRKLIKHSLGARNAFKSVLAQQIRKEMAGLIKTGSLLKGKIDMERIQNFEWKEVLEDLKIKTPLLCTAVYNSVLRAKNEKTMTCVSSGRSLTPIIGIALSVLLFGRKPTMFNLMQGINSIELWQNGCSRNMFTHFNHLGLCMSRSTSMKILSKLKIESDEKLLDMKTKIEELDLKACEGQNPFIEASMVHGDTTQRVSSSSSSKDDISSKDSDFDYTNIPSPEIEISSDSKYSSSEGKISEVDILSTSDISETEKMDEICPGYTIVWDNVGKHVKTRHHSAESQNKMMLWALSYAAINRVPTSLLDDQQAINARDIKIEQFLPDDNDMKRIRDRMGIVLQRILCKYIPCMKEMTSVVVKHIKHDFWLKSTEKSDVINLGVLQENPSTIAGVVNILEHLQQKYVPKKDGKLYRLICYGDGLSCERHNDAHMVRATCLSTDKRLEGLEPGIQEFHRKMLKLQDIMDIFFSGSSQSEKGTLCHLKNAFGHNNVKKDVGQSFNYANDFIQFVTHGYVVLAAMKILNIEELDDEPTGEWDLSNVMNDIDKKNYLNQMSQKILELVWKDVKVKDILNATKVESKKQERYDHCICKTDLGDVPVVYCNNQNCQKGEIFHLECMNLAEDEVTEEWYCSTECRKIVSSYPFCICKTDITDGMVGCDNQSCKKGQWFHFSCINTREEDVTCGDWFCCEKCKEEHDTNVKDPDYASNYVNSLMLCGLLHMTSSDAIRENDGPAIISQWKYDLIGFHNRHHYKYVILAHRLIASISGWLPERLRQDLIWNRTVNVSGGPGRNLEADLVNELLNKEFKESLKDAGGNLTPETVARHSQLVGHMRKELNRIYLEQMAEAKIQKQTKHYKSKFDEDIKKFVEILKDENLFSSKPGRQFKSFKNFCYSPSSVKPSALNKKLYQLSARLDELNHLKCVD